MNILFIGSDPTLFVEGSAARVRLRSYAEVVAEKGGVLHTLMRGPHTAMITDGPLRIHGVRAGRLSALLRLPAAAHRLILEESIAVVSAQDPFEHGWMALRACRGTSAKLHLQVHTDFLTPWFTRGRIARSPVVKMPALNWVRRRIALKILPQAQGIRTVSHRVADSLTRVFGARIPVPTVIPIAVSVEPVEAVELPPAPFTFALISVGRLEPEKRIQDIIAAVARIKDAYPMLGAFIVGEGRERPALMRMARKLGLEDRIVFLGNRRDARGLMKSAQGFIQASAYEGYGLTLIEAALARVPIITTDVGVVGEVFQGFEHVLAAPVGDPVNLAAHIAWLIEDHRARTELAMNAEERVLRHLAETDSSPRAVIEDMTRLV